MKSGIENCLASTISHLPEKRFSTWCLILMIQSLQLMEPGTHLLALEYPHHSLIKVTNTVVGFSTLRPVTQYFPLFPFLIQLGYIVYLILQIYEFLSLKFYVSEVIVEAEIFCPVVMTAAVELIKKQHVLIVIIAIFCFVTAAALWALRLVTIRQDLMSRNAKLSNIKSLLRMIVFTMQSVMIYLSTMFPIVTIFGAICLGMLCVVLILSLIKIENIDEGLEYLHYLKVIFATSFYVAFQVILIQPQMDFLLLAIPVTMIGLERAGILKLLFEVKYNYLLERIISGHDQEDLVVFLELLSNGKPGNPDSGQSKSGRCKNDWTSKEIEFSFHMKARATCIQLCLKISKESGESAKVQFLLKQQTQSVVEDIMYKQIRGKSRLLLFVLSYQSLKRDLLVKSLSIMTSIQGEMDFNMQVMKKVLKLRIDKINSIKQRMGTICQINFGKCSLGNSIPSSKINEVRLLQDFFQSFISRLEHLSDLTMKLLTKLTVSTIKSNEVLQILSKQSDLKAQINKQVLKMDTIINKEIITAFYIYYRQFCSQKFSVFQSLAKYLIVYDRVRLATRHQYMVCMVSAASSNRGTIMTANANMVQFFNMDFEHIKKGNDHIEDILPKPLRVVHNKLIGKFLETGMSSIIGVGREFYVVKGSTAFPVEFQIKFQPYTEGINFSVEFRVLKDASFILYDSNNEILGFSPSAQALLPKKKQECRYLQEVFPRTRRALRVQNNSESTIMTMSTRLSEFQLKYSLENKVYKRPEFLVGTCTFDKNEVESLDIIPAADGDQVTITKSKRDTLVSINHDEMDRQFLNLEKKTKSIQKTANLVSPFTGVMFGYGLILLVSTIVYFDVLSGTVERSITFSKFLSIIYTNNLEMILLSITRIYQIRNAVDNGVIPQNASIGNITDMATFLSQQANSELQIFFQYKNSILNQAKVLPAEFVNIMSNRKIKFYTPSGSLVLMDFSTFATILYSEEKELCSISKQSFERIWDWISYIMGLLTNNVMLDLANYIQNPSSLEIAAQKELSVTQLKKGLIVIESIATVGIIVVYFFIYRTIQDKIKYTGLLLLVDNQALLNKLALCQEISLVLNQIVKSNMSQLTIDPDSNTMSFNVRAGNVNLSSSNILINQKTEMHLQESRLDNSTHSSRKSLNNFKYKLKQYSKVSMVSLLFFPVVILMLIGFLNTLNSSLRAQEFYQMFVQSNSKTSLCAASLVSIDILKITNSTQTNIFQQPLSDYLKTAYQCITTRAMDDILMDYVPFVSEDQSIQHQIEDYLFLSKCKPGDMECPTVLSGAITRGIPAALVAFITDIMSLAQALGNHQFPYSSDNMASMTKLIEAYTMYIRGISQMTGFALEITNKVFSSNLVELGLLMYSSALAEVMLIGILLKFMVSERMDIQNLKREIMTILPVDVLVDNINFNYEIRNMS